MRNLVILRGAMGSGKSTWLKENNLEQFTLCPDTIRLMYSAPQMQSGSKDYTINQKNDSQVWALLFEILEERMKKGEFTIIDATHSRQTDFSRYNDLCATYRYRRYWVDFTDIPMEQCKTQNATREPSWKRVPNSAIEKCYARFETQEPSSGWVKVERNKFAETFANKSFDFNKYDKIHIFGDIHSSYEPLIEYLNNNMIVNVDKPQLLNENEFYIFVGDYLERGTQPKETLELLCALADRPNTLFLPGNHEEWLRMFAFGDINNIRNKEFIHKTMYAISDIPHEKISNFVRKMGQMAYIEYDNQKYFITHGGVNHIPDTMAFVSTDTFIHGVGDYTCDIDQEYEQHYNGIIQIHGHRNTYDIKIDEYEHSWNLNGNVEFGGHLRVVTLAKGKLPEYHYIKNNNYDVRASEKVLNTPIESSENIIDRLRSHPFIRETDLGNNVSSFNFTREAFFKKEWDNATTTARGLFMNTETGQVVARAYNKFFNINERDESKLINIRSIMEKSGEPAIAYKKYNGYLGVLSYYNGELHFHSKSTDKGDFAEWFKDIFMRQFTGDINKVAAWLQEHNESWVFEVVDPIRDPHIIKETEQFVVLLDIINNSLEYNKVSYYDLCCVGNEFKIPVKEIVAEFQDYRSLMQYWLEHTKEDNFDDTGIEGVVIEIGTFMTKLKFNYYNFWKNCRKLVDSARKKRNIKLSSLINDTDNFFWSWLKEQDNETLQKDIITLRDMFLNK